MAYQVARHRLWQKHKHSILNMDRASAGRAEHGGIQTACVAGTTQRQSPPSTVSSPRMAPINCPQL